MQNNTEMFNKWQCGFMNYAVLYGFIIVFFAVYIKLSKTLSYTWFEPLSLQTW